MRDRIDELLDGAIVSYVDAPRPGMELRILHHVRTRNRRSWFAAPVFAAAALACFALACLTILEVTRVERAPAELPVASIKVPEIPPFAIPRVPPRVAIRRHVTLPKQATFPMATPLSDGERAFVALMRHHPETAAAVAESLNRSSEPIKIKEIEIRPIQAESGQ